jgi:DNA-binding transcriptional LysR family regulator
MTDTRRLVNRLRLKHWSLLSALAETGTLNQAAGRINVTQPSATKMLSDIESAFGFALFERHARGMRPTALGGEIVGYARQAEASLDRFMEDLEQKRRGGHGQLVFGAIMGAAPDVVALAVADLKRERPRLNIRIIGETSDQIDTLLERHEIELAVGRFATPEQHNRFDFSALANERLQVVVRREHPLARRRQANLALLSDWPWILQPLTSPARVLLEDEFARAGLASPVNVVECTSVFATLQLVQSSDAVAVLPESVIRDHVRAGLLRALPVVVGLGLEAFGVLSRKGEELAEPAQMLVHHLRRHAVRQQRKG